MDKFRMEVIAWVVIALHVVTLVASAVMGATYVIVAFAFLYGGGAMVIALIVVAVELGELRKKLTDDD